MIEKPRSDTFTVSKTLFDLSVSHNCFWKGKMPQFYASEIGRSRRTQKLYPKLGCEMRTKKIYFGTKRKFSIFKILFVIGLQVLAYNELKPKINIKKVAKRNIQLHPFLAVSGQAVSGQSAHDWLKITWPTPFNPDNGWLCSTQRLILSQNYQILKIFHEGLEKIPKNNQLIFFVYFWPLITLSTNG